MDEQMNKPMDEPPVLQKERSGFGPLLKAHSGLSSLVTTVSNADERHRPTSTRGINVKSAKPRAAAQRHHPDNHKITELSVPSSPAMTRRNSLITAPFSRTTSKGEPLALPDNAQETNLTWEPSTRLRRASLVPSSGQQGPLITRTASISRTASIVRSRRRQPSLPASPAMTRRSSLTPASFSRSTSTMEPLAPGTAPEPISVLSRRGSVSHGASIVRAVSATLLAELLARGDHDAGAEGREKGVGHEPPMRRRPNPKNTSHFSSSHSYSTRSRSPAMGLEGEMNLLMSLA